LDGKQECLLVARALVVLRLERKPRTIEVDYGRNSGRNESGTVAVSRVGRGSWQASGLHVGDFVGIEQCCAQVAWM
jgi:hypothetical protein